MLSPFKLFLLMNKSVVYTHTYLTYISAGSLARIIHLGMTADVFELSHKNKLFTGCGDINYDIINFTVLITWMSGIEDTTKKMH